jgi:hypothetical protein
VFSSTARTLLRFAVVAVTTTSRNTVHRKVCCLHCSMTVNTVRNLLIMGTFENGLPTECCYSSIYHPDPKSICLSPCSTPVGETLETKISLFLLNFERKRLELVSTQSNLNVPTSFLLISLMFYGRSWRVSVFFYSHGR